MCLIPYITGIIALTEGLDMFRLGSTANSGRLLPVSNLFFSETKGILKSPHIGLLRYLKNLIGVTKLLSKI
jgi:hypothetical protein